MMKLGDNRYSYSFPTNIRFGAGAVDELGDHLKEQGHSRPLIVSDPVVSELPFFKAIVAQLDRQGLEPVVFSEISKNPVKSDVLAGGDAYKVEDCDSIVGLGGGAAMDVSRAIALRINNHRDLFDYDDLIGGDKLIDGAIPYFVTIPTTSGTGSEVGRSAIISEDESKRKRILFHPTLLAKQVFADPALTYDLPAAVTAATGMDALTHNMEAYIAKGIHPMADGIALEGIRLIFGSIEAATNKPDPDSRAAMMIASLMGAVAFQKGLGVVHSLAHPLSTMLDMHHGLANAINLPYGMRFNLSGFEDRFATMAQTMGLEKHNGEAVIEALFDLNRKLNLPLTLSEAGVEEAHLEPLSVLAEADFAHPNNPKPVSRADFLAIYHQAL